MKFYIAVIAGGLVNVCSMAQTLPRFDSTPGAERVPGTLYVDEGEQEIYWPKAGYHALSLKLGRSSGLVQVQTPADSNPMPITLGDLFRPESPDLVSGPGNFLVLGIPEEAYGQAEQMIETAKGSYRLGVEGARVIEEVDMGKVVEFTGDGSGLRLYDWPCVGRYLTMAFWIKLPENAPRKEFLQIGREGATGFLDSRTINMNFPRFYTTQNKLRIQELEEGRWVHLGLQWGPWTKIFVNGELRSKIYTAGDSCMQSRPSNHNARSEQMQLFVGRDGSFKGRIAGLRMCDTPLKDGDMRKLYRERP